MNDIVFRCLRRWLVALCAWTLLCAGLAIPRPAQGQAPRPATITDTSTRHFIQYFLDANADLLRPEARERISRGTLRPTLRTALDPVRYGLIATEDAARAITVLELLRLNLGHGSLRLACRQRSTGHERILPLARLARHPGMTRLGTLVPADCGITYVVTVEGKPVSMRYASRTDMDFAEAPPPPIAPPPEPTMVPASAQELADARQELARRREENARLVRDTIASDRERSRLAGENERLYALVRNSLAFMLAAVVIAFIVGLIRRFRAKPSADAERMTEPPAASPRPIEQGANGSDAELDQLREKYRQSEASRRTALEGAATDLEDARKRSDASERRRHGEEQRAVIAERALADLRKELDKAHAANRDTVSQLRAAHENVSRLEQERQNDELATRQTVAAYEKRIERITRDLNSKNQENTNLRQALSEHSVVRNLGGVRPLATDAYGALSPAEDERHTLAGFGGNPPIEQSPPQAQAAPEHLHPSLGEPSEPTETPLVKTLNGLPYPPPGLLKPDPPEGPASAQASDTEAFQVLDFSDDGPAPGEPSRTPAAEVTTGVRPVINVLRDQTRPYESRPEVNVAELFRNTRDKETVAVPAADVLAKSLDAAATPPDEQTTRKMDRVIASDAAAALQQPPIKPTVPGPPPIPAGVAPRPPTDPFFPSEEDPASARRSVTS